MEIEGDPSRNSWEKNIENMKKRVENDRYANMKLIQEKHWKYKKKKLTD